MSFENNTKSSKTDFSVNGSVIKQVKKIPVIHADDEKLTFTSHIE